MEESESISRFLGLLDTITEYLLLSLLSLLFFLLLLLILLLFLLLLLLLLLLFYFSVYPGLLPMNFFCK